MLEVTLNQAKEMIMAMGQTQSIMLLASPGVGKSDIVRSISEELEQTQGYGPCRTLLGTQIAPEDVSGIPRIEKDRSVFFPPEILLPSGENPRPFVLFLDELPICTPDVQKAMYSLLLDRRLGKYDLPRGTIVVAAGNNIHDRAMVRTMSSALINRVIILHVKVDPREWLTWGQRMDPRTGRQNVRNEILEFIASSPDCLQTKEIPDEPNTPFATPRSWAMFSNAMDNLENYRREHGGKELDVEEDVRILGQGTIGQETADMFCDYRKFDFKSLKKPSYYIENPEEFPGMGDSGTIARRAVIVSRIRKVFADPESEEFQKIKELGENRIQTFFESLSPEIAMVFVNNIEKNIRLLAPRVLTWLAGNAGK